MITGATGFVGQSLCATLTATQHDFKAVVRRPSPSYPYALVVPDINPQTDWRPVLHGIDIVVHLAARVHVLHDGAHDPLHEYRLTNCDSTLNLARQCAQTGVKRFIYLSSVKVNGESTGDRPFNNADLPQPCDPYGISKWEAEQGLQKIAHETGLEIVIIRPPLIYGPQVKANFLQLMRWVKYGIPLPLAGINNRRSMVFVGNLVDLIMRCAINPSAAGHTFLVSDGVDVSTSQLIRSIAHAMERRANIFTMPQDILMAGARLLGKTAVAERLFGSLQVDIQHTKETLDWGPPFSFETGIEKTVNFFKNT